MKTGQSAYCRPPRRARGVHRRRTVDDTTRHPAFQRLDPLGREAVRFRGGGGQSRADDLRDADRRAGRTGSGNCPTASRNCASAARALEAWGGLHAGFLGRAPDHVASCIAGMYMGLDVFEAYDPARAKALADYYRLCPRQRPLSDLRHHQSAGRSLEERRPAEGRRS